ncbi:MCE family protein [Actinophytocola oryzae]|uniref:Phospholipid/cholesterol/gamma-HCH transport system substrate-binding protein n=1 Tax=Actinophytocola oryzae TaxID=502181 RepID=A0A4R7UXZ7_9PSEU|nr:MlaD family protein [Actinophytocola oryzae]TDV41390.1 phospholipid/cholesterol/gamma-HCH transport system substrate-binding protein [Actinophytocola oryzae]
MLTRVVRWQVLAFVVISLAVVAFVGANYAGLDRLFGGGTYTVRLELADGGGLFTNSEVTYRGVAVGRVGDMRLTDRGMEADLLLDDSGQDIPVDTEAVVANRSAIGEQFVDLQPRTDGGPFLADGDVIRREQTSVPMPVTTLLSNLSALNESVPTESLRVVVDELYTAMNDTGPSLQLLLDSTMSFTDEASRHLPQTTMLIDDGATVLRTQLDSSSAWRDFSDNAKLFAHELATSDGDLRRLIGTAPAAATQLSQLLADTNPGLPVLVANLLTTSEIFESRIGGMRQLFVNLPKAVAATSTSIRPDGAHLSITLNFYNPSPCVTGYDSPYRPGADTSYLPFDTSGACTLPDGDPRLVRGAQNAPRGGVPDPAVPGGGVSMPGPLGVPDLPLASSMKELLWLEK